MDIVTKKDYIVFKHMILYATQGADMVAEAREDSIAQSVSEFIFFVEKIIDNDSQRKIAAAILKALYSSEYYQYSRLIRQSGLLDRDDTSEEKFRAQERIDFLLQAAQKFSEISDTLRDVSLSSTVESLLKEEVVGVENLILKLQLQGAPAGDVEDVKD
jgi:hypothetical protein